MAKEQATGLSIHGGALRWTVLRSSKSATPAIIEARSSQLQLEAGDGADIACLSEADSTAIATQLRAIKGSISGQATVALSSEHVLMRSVELPAVDPAELASMVELQADKFSPFPAESAVTSYEIVGQTETSSRVVVATAQRTNVETVGALLSQAGILPRRMDVETMCWWRLLSDAKQVPDTGCSIVILKDKAVCDIIIALTGTPVIIRGLGKVSSLSDEDLCTELEYTLTSLENEHGINRADIIRLWHWDDAPLALLKMLKERFDTDVQAASFQSLPTLSEGMARRTLDGSKTLLNLTIPEWETVQQVARMRRNLVNASIAAAALWVVMIGGLFLLFQTAKRGVGPLEERAAKSRAIETQDAETRDLLIAAKQYSDIKYSAISCLRETAMLKPADLEFDSFTYNKAYQPFKREGTKKARHDNAKTNQVVIVGHAQSQNIVLDFQNALQSQSTMFTRVVPGRITSAQNQDRFSFTMTLDLPRRTDEAP